MVIGDDMVTNCGDDSSDNDEMSGGSKKKHRSACNVSLGNRELWNIVNSLTPMDV